MKKRITIIITIIFILAIAVFTGLKIWIGQGVKANIELAQQKYHDNPEDALIAFLTDSSNSPEDRTHLAAWTLGQIESEKALPILQSYYKGDPTGETCYGKHQTLLCQYEIYKAMTTIEEGRLFSYAYLKH